MSDVRYDSALTAGNVSSCSRVLSWGRPEPTLETAAVSDPLMDQIPLRNLSRKQRRVLGTLLEKGFTTPEQYPLTVKATVAGCNQKSNREPTTNYDEDDVQKTLDELRELGFVGEVHTEGGRSARYRHYLRHRTHLSEPQLAVMTELMLRGRQQLGELRTRASRMVNIATQEELRPVLQSLLAEGLVRASGSLDRRGVEVDHNLYVPGERYEPFATTPVDEGYDAAAAGSPTTAAMRTEGITGNVAPSVAISPAASAVPPGLATVVEELSHQLAELRQQVADLKDELSDLRRQLGA